VLSINQETNWAARRAKTIVEGLMKRLKVEVPDSAVNPHTHLLEAAQHDQPLMPAIMASGDASVVELTEPAGFSPGLDIDAVIQSFVPANENNSNVPFPAHTSHQLVADDSNRQIGFTDQNVMDYGIGVFQENQTQGTNGWYSNFMPHAFQFDDLLFGFNGSTIDDFSMQTHSS